MPSQVTIIAEDLRGGVPEAPDVKGLVRELKDGARRTLEIARSAPVLEATTQRLTDLDRAGEAAPRAVA